MDKEIKKVTGLINDVKFIKEGETNNKKWTIYEVIIDGKKYTAFDNEYKNRVNTQSEWAYTEKEKEYNGVTTIQKTLLDLRRKPKSEPAQDSSLEKRVEKLERELEELRQIVNPF